MTSADTPALSAAGLSVKLGGTEILKGVNLRVDQGDLYGLLGRNGAGKTTSLRCILGFLPPSGGDCRVFGVPGHALHTCPFPIGVALDPPGLDDSLTVRQNLELAVLRGGISGGRGVDEALDLVGLTYRQHNRGDRLSHGQGRRAAVARALLGSPRLLVMDEPLSGLDPEGVEMLIGLFRQLAFDEGVTVVLSSHHLREVQDVCTRVGMIEQGYTILQGETRKLLRQAGDGLRLRVAADQIQAALAYLQKNDALASVDNRGEGHLFCRVHQSTNWQLLLSQLVAQDFGLSEFGPEQATLVDVFTQALAKSDAPVEVSS
ncbi:MAG: ABC transporter ATP-binding protein [Planctomycetes bacterium]|jgi:ABC-type multidrug transport system ATPase subunit|nr:ABC transporter ATP-binding protein [Planctomycetota bacterium]MBT4028796.1 ABC transporter ATP-binding protein [Planctomycetota bacterium]MBT4559644.1 ABC transporter ATP-binding protein [Planctomycetota bacterium]MBT5100676.1 ABC transporter ATP-binding protein [Planctomycetota bacterium]MBT5119786.1 ABC transporter ATP-binding protein [Planctomycetota bacterium]